MRISDWSSDVCSSDLLNSIALANFAFVMAVNTANSILMSREIFNDHAAARQPRPGSRHGLSLELLTMLVSGPAGATDPVLWTLLLRDRPAHPRAAERSEEQTAELQSLIRFSYAVFCLKQKKNARNDYMYYQLNHTT